MADWHLKELNTELQKRGWRLVAEHLESAGTVRGFGRCGDLAITIRFFSTSTGLDGYGGCCLCPKVTAVKLRGNPSLYLTRRGQPKSPARKRWRQRYFLRKGTRINGLMASNSALLTDA